MAHLAELKQELRRNFLEWGVDQDIPEHRRFAQRALKTALGYHQSSPTKLTSNRPEPRFLTKDLPLAIEEIFTNDVEEMDTKHCRIVYDSTGGKSFTPPYRVRPDKYRPGKFHVKAKWEYDRLTKRALDPLSRLSFKKCTKREFFVSKWLRALREDPDTLEGLVFEAVVSSHAIHNEACFLCRRRNTLRWNGGSHAPWTDMVCIGCESAFEIKSKRNMERIESAFERVLRGGSYGGYCALHWQGRKKGWKHFLVTVSRTPSYTLRMEKCWNVQIAEIDRVLPRLSHSSFLHPLEKEEKIPFQSVIVTKSSWKPWFRIPYVPCDYESIVLKVLEQKFPGYRKASEPQKMELTRKTSTKEETRQTYVNEIDALRSSLETMSANDCWEDMIDEDD